MVRVMPWGSEMNEPARAGRRARKAIARAEKHVAYAERRFGPGDRLTPRGRVPSGGDTPRFECAHRPIQWCICRHVRAVRLV